MKEGARGHLARDVLVHGGGRVWSALMAVAFVPAYVRLLGIEAYGIIAFFTTLYAVFGVIDVSLTTTVNRQLAARSALSEAESPTALVRTLEVVYWLLAIAAAGLVVSAANWAATRWFQSVELSERDVAGAMTWMGIALLFQWPVGFYSGALVGLERHVSVNVLLVASSTLRYAGGVAVLQFWSPTLSTFFAWQAVVSGAFAAITAALLWRRLGGFRRARFSAAELKSVGRFATGMGAISITVLFLTQMDKVLLSRLLPLDAFGYYSLGALAGSSLYVLVTPVTAAVFPRLARSVATGTAAVTAETYHQGTQMVGAIMVPVAAVLIAFAPEVLSVWIGSGTVAERASPLMRVLVLGFALNGLMNLPYMLQLAYGWTRLTLTTNIVGLTLLVPALLYLAPRYGAAGAAAVWLALNLGFLVIQLPLVHRHVLQGHLARWYVVDVGRPAAVAAGTVLLARLLTPVDGERAIVAMWLMLVTVATVSITAVAVPAVMARLRAYVLKAPGVPTA